MSPTQLTLPGEPETVPTLRLVLLYCGLIFGVTYTLNYVTADLDGATRAVVISEAR